MANTTYQYLLHKWNAVVKSNLVVGEGATLQTHHITGGTFIANGATPVTVADANVGANSCIVITLKTVGGTVSVIPPTIPTITVGTGFTVAAQALDTSTYNYQIHG